MLQLRDYQIKGIDGIADKYSKGIRRMIFQLATGGGKTVTFAGLSYRFKVNVPKKIVIAVHREELLHQARNTLYKWYGLVAEPIVAGIKYCNPAADVYVGMVETVYNRLKKNPQFFGEVGLLIIDEAHLGNFKKLHQFFPEVLTVGFTATPLSASKKHPLKQDYEDIVCGIDIPDLIRQGSLMPNRTYVVKTAIDRDKLKVKNGEFDNAAMGREFGKSRYVEATVDGYEKHALGTKALVFNCNIEHSKLVTQAFIDRGFPAKHLDSEMPVEERRAILQWFAETPGAILNNIGILTAGFDEPSVETVIMNRATLSLPLWLQCTGRGSRPFPGKTFFTIIDLGGNAAYHGDWSTPRDWDYIFHNPAKPGKGGGVAPVKICDSCEALISLNANVCQYCGCLQPIKEQQYDKKPVEFELLESSIDISSITTSYQLNGANSYAALHQVKYIIVEEARKTSGAMDSIRAYKLLEVYQHKVEAWCRQQGKNYDQWHKDTTASWFFQELKKKFGWEPEPLRLAL